MLGQSHETVLVPVVTNAPVTGVGGAQFDCALYTYDNGLSRVMVEHGVNGRLLSIDHEIGQVGLRLVLTSNIASGPAPKPNFVP
ncbi:MAG TPA: hypothetical protein VHX14_05025, partial [Thermoanaerobaculia bacterium]|nr:hypothetical protein [Thermoanaerobaculia bacterium]